MAESSRSLRMADERATPEGPQEAHDATHDAAHSAPRRKKRTPPTIDLTAQEVAEAVPDSAGQDAHPQPKSTGTQSNPGPEPGYRSEPDATDAPRGKAWSNTNLISTLGAGLAGGTVVAVIMAALWYTDVMPVRTVGPGAAPDRLAAMEATLRDLQNRPAAPADASTIKALSERIAKIEQTVAKLPARDPTVAERLATADNAMKSLGVALTALNRRSDDVAANATKALDRADSATKAVTELRTSVEAIKNASAGIKPAELDALEKRLASLEQSAKSTSEKSSKSTAADLPARLALTAAGLRDAVLSGAPFAAELAEVKSLGADDKALALLEPFAAAGVPSEKALAHELGGLIPAMLRASGVKAPSGGFLDRLQANADRLVRIRPVNAPTGDDPAAVLARIENAAAHADIPAAIADLAKLPDHVRAPAADWIAKAQGRQAALAAARRFAAESARALGSR
jgi:hypothetical protein